MIMARPLRLELAGGYYHLTARGVGRQPIFFDDADREEFLKRLAEVHEGWGAVFHGYCLMLNHYHLEVETPQANLSRAMQWLNQVYASRVNLRHRRVGHLFQGRFKCVLVEKDSHLCLLTRYIHLNPVRAGLARRPEDYAWSSYGAYVGLRRCPGWLDVRTTLEMFGKSVSEQRRRYREFVEEGTAQDPLKEMVFGAVLGTEKFVEWAREKLRDRREDAEVSGLVKARPEVSLDAICSAVCKEVKSEESAVRARGRRGNETRDVGIYLSREHTNHSLEAIGAYWGGIRPSAASLACKRVETRLGKESALRRRIASLVRGVAEDQRSKM
ncbi:MAG: hypothetical protein FJ279_33535 [Planctomycetes bacterium]|nr:hypothetical protein [Planctomycetota bacterium]MBM4084553.1 hypothetical protein [Planctomycetota bacterium]